MNKCERIDFVDVEDITPDLNNPNMHTKEQIERLCEIIKYQGFRRPLTVSTLDGKLVVGHGRLMAAKKLGIDKVPVIYQPYDNYEQQYADMTADNAIDDWATLDLSKINVDIQDLGPDFDINMLGIKDFVIEPMEKYGDKDPDQVPDVPEEPRTQLGDLIILGKHRLLCGDSTVKENIDKLMDGKKADMVFTDPPYGMNLDTHYDQIFENDLLSSHERNRFKKVIGDDKEYNPEKIFEFFDCDKFIFGCDYFYNHLPKGGSFIAWDKRDDNLDRVPGNTTEFCWSDKPRRRCSVRIKWSGHHGMSGDDTKKRVHPTQKPTSLAEWFFEKWGKNKNIIVDLFLGSGSTLIACEKTNRICYGMELDPNYVDVIIKRWCDYTGNNKYIRNDKEESIK